MNDYREWGSTRQPSEQPLLRVNKGPRAQPSTAAEEESFAELAVKREAIRKANHRDGDRHRVEEELVQILHDGAQQAVTLINLSGGGAMIDGARDLKLWDSVLLQLGECGRVEAAVRWVRGERYGLEFAHETRVDGTPEERTRVLRKVISRSFPDVVARAEARDARAASSVASQPAPMPRRDEIERDLRHPLIWSGLVHYDHQTFEVRLRNISAGGALVECQTSLKVGAELMLELDTAGSFFATVNWSRGDTAGLRFHQPFDLQNLAAARPSLASQRWVAPDYLRDSHSAHGPWAKQWGRSDLGEIHSHLGPAKLD